MYVVVWSLSKIDPYAGPKLFPLSSAIHELKQVENQSDTDKIHYKRKFAAGFITDGKCGCLPAKPA